MNYEQARQIGPDGPAPGKWNWSNFNDSVADTPYTVEPCAWPDSPIPPEWQFGEPLQRAGRERCDHDTAEEAERHHYEYEVSRIRWQPIETASASQLVRCDVPDCTAWADGASASVGGWPRGDFCETHANEHGYREAHPFRSGEASIHS